MDKIFETSLKQHNTGNVQFFGSIEKKYFWGKTGY